MAEANARLNAGEYLRAVDFLRASFDVPPDRNLLTFDMWWQIHAMIATTPDMRYAEQGEPHASREMARQLRTAGLENAISAIVERARRTRIVILNEAHHSPRDRAFALQVARALRPLGYTYLAAEAFENRQRSGETQPPVATMARDGFPRLTQGFYLKDPAFGDFVRQSLRAGYRPVAYEYVPPVPRDPAVSRDRVQAQNLVGAIFSRDPHARVFVYVGYAHAAERPVGDDPSEWMAGHLARETGIDPLTIDQTFISEYHDESPANRELHRIVASRGLRAASVLMSGGRPLVVGIYAGAVDLQVVHPRTRFRGGRPTWLSGMDRSAVRVPRHLLPAAGRRLVQAFIAAEPPDAVPVDQVLVEAGRPAPFLMLPRQTIRFAVQDSP
jgi:hypothetical protein